MAIAASSGAAALAVSYAGEGFAAVKSTLPYVSEQFYIAATTAQAEAVMMINSSIYMANAATAQALYIATRNYQGISQFVHGVASSYGSDASAGGWPGISGYIMGQIIQILPK